MTYELGGRSGGTAVSEPRQPYKRVWDNSRTRAFSGDPDATAPPLVFFPLPSLLIWRAG